MVQPPKSPLLLESQGPHLTQRVIQPTKFTQQMARESGFLQVCCSKIPQLFQSWNDNFPDETIKLSHKCQKWYIS